MRRLLCLTAGTVPILLIISTVNAIFNIDYSTGFLIKARILPLLVFIAIFAFSMIIYLVSRYKYAEHAVSSESNGSLLTAVMLSLCAFAAVVASMYELNTVGVDGAVFKLFKSSAKLADLGIAVPQYFRIKIITSILGILAALWFILAVATRIKDDGQSLCGGVFPITVTLWCISRVICCYVSGPINIMEITSFGSIVSLLSLLILYSRLTRSVSLGAYDPMLDASAAFSLLWCSGTVIPSVAMAAVNRNTALALSSALNILLAATAFMMTLERHGSEKISVTFGN